MRCSSDSDGAERTFLGGALRTQMALSGHDANFGALQTVRCNGAFFSFLNVCPFL